MFKYFPLIILQISLVATLGDDATEADTKAYFLFAIIHTLAADDGTTGR